MRRLSIALFLCCGLAAAAQENLIRNWSFEELDSNIFGQYLCPASAGKIHFAKHWNSAHGSVDYFNACSNENWPLWGVPGNLYGQQEAYDGEAYAALVTYSPIIANGREYVRQKLEQPLRYGQWYRLKFRVSLCDSMNWACTRIGALFTHYDTQTLIDSIIGRVPHVQNQEHFYLADKSSWMTIEGLFLATGGEEYITIGTFQDDSQIEVTEIFDQYTDPIRYNLAVYYIDAIELYEDDNIEVGELTPSKMELFPNPGFDQVQLETKGSFLTAVTIKDHYGRTILTQKVQGRACTIQIEPYTAGVYTVSVHLADGAILHQRLLKQ